MFKVKIPSELFQQVHDFHNSGSYEQISYLFGNLFNIGGESILLVPVQKPILLADSCFDLQNQGRVRLKREVQLKVYAMFAKSGFNCLINIHDHPFSAMGTRFSGIDDEDDRVQLDYLLNSLGKSEAYKSNDDPRLVSLVFDRTTFDGREVLTNKFRQLDKVHLLARNHLDKYANGSSFKRQVINEAMTRHSTFISEFNQAKLQEMHVALIGAGGLGSILSEGLIRLGVKKLTIIDDDLVEKSNLNRLQSAKFSDVGKRKVDVIKNYLIQLFDELDINAIAESLNSENCYDALQSADVIFGALDNDAARLTLTKFSAQFLTPYFDLGTAVTIDDKVDFKSRMFFTIPCVTSCMNCSKFEILDRKQAEYSAVDTDMLKILRNRGYINQLPEDESTPSVYALNMSAVGMLLTEFLNWVNCYKPVATVISSSFLKNHYQRADFSNFEEPYNRNCDCCANRFGVGKDYGLLGLSPSTTTSEILENASKLIENFSMSKEEI